jgi:hypothetical protein
MLNQRHLAHNILTRDDERRVSGVTRDPSLDLAWLVERVTCGLSF